jgi:hypothetical protein
VSEAPQYTFPEHGLNFNCDVSSAARSRPGTSIPLHFAPAGNTLNIPPILTRPKASILQPGKTTFVALGRRRRFLPEHHEPVCSFVLQSCVTQLIRLEDNGISNNVSFVFRVSHSLMLISSPDCEQIRRNIAFILSYTLHVIVLTLAAYYMIALIYTTKILPSLTS